MEPSIKARLIQTSKRAKSFLADFAWVFPPSGEKHRRELFYFWFGIPFGLFIWGCEVTSNYEMVRWAFFSCWATTCTMSWLSFNVLASSARRFWTGAIALSLAFLLVSFYDYICPGVYINPSSATFAALSKDGFSQTYPFRIANQTDNDFSSVFFTIRIDSKTASLKDFRFDIPKSSQVPLEGDTATPHVADIIGADCVNGNGGIVWYRSIQHLGPHESREVTLTRINPSAESDPGSGTSSVSLTPDGSGPAIKLKASVVSFDKDTSRLVRPGLELGNKMKIMDKDLRCDVKFKNLD